MSRVIGFYHKNCTDGYGAAYVLHLKWGKAIKLVPYMYGDTIEGVYENDQLIFVDCSVPPEDAEALLELGANITIIDHHKTAYEAYEASDIKRKYEGRIDLTFDMNKSGATLAWAKYYGDALAPDVLRYIEDRDLWKKQLPDCDAFYYGLNTFEWYKDGQLDFRPLALMPNELISIGRTVMAVQKEMMTASLGHITELDISTSDTTGWPVPAINCSIKSLVSDLGAAVLAKTKAPLVVLYSISSENVTFSLRSNQDDPDGGQDVGHIAKLFGGGGHRNAAGFALPLEEGLKFLSERLWSAREW